MPLRCNSIFLNLFSFNCRCAHQRMRNVSRCGRLHDSFFMVLVSFVSFSLIWLVSFPLRRSGFHDHRHWHSVWSSVTNDNEAIIQFTAQWGKVRGIYSFSALNCRHSSNCIRFGNLSIFPLLRTMWLDRDDSRESLRLQRCTRTELPHINAGRSIALSSGPTFFRLHSFRNHNLYVYCRLPCIRCDRCVKWCHQSDDRRLCECARECRVFICYISIKCKLMETARMCVCSLARDEPPKQP